MSEPAGIPNPDPKDLPTPEDPIKNRAIDIVFVIDLSESMKPCIGNLVMNLGPLVAEIEKGQGLSSRGEQVPVDWRLGLVMHNSLHSGKTKLRVLDITRNVNPETPVPTNIDLVREKLQQSGGLLANSEATLHAMDWAMDNISWRWPEGGYRRFLVVFTDEPIGGGDMQGISEESFKKFLDKLYNFNLFFVGPCDPPPVDGAGIQVDYRQFRPFSYLKGFQHVADASEAAWGAINFNELISRLGRTLTSTTIPESAQQPMPNLFGFTVPPGEVEYL